MLYRDKSRQIKKWIQSGQNVLLVDGARQVGKTYLIEQCLQSGGCDYLEINFLDRKTAAIRDLFNHFSSLDDLYFQLSGFFPKHRLIPGKTIFFLDEIQELDDVLTAAKFFALDKRYRFILSGSLLGVSLKVPESAPVGYLDYVHLYPLDFHEFFLALGYPEELFSFLETCYREKKPVPEPTHSQLLHVFDLYLTVGGMPQAVNAYLETNDMVDIAQAHKVIRSLYKLDFIRYEKTDRRLVLTQIYDLIPSFLSRSAGRFIVSDVAKGARIDRLHNSFVWLANAGVALPCYNVADPRGPLKPSVRHSLFKLYDADVGMLTSAMGLESKTKILSQDPSFNKGGIYENYAAMALKAKGYDLYYYDSKELGGVDFLVEKGGAVLPIEIKSGPLFDKHAAFNRLLSDHPSIKEGRVYGRCNIQREGRILYLPIYMLCLLGQQAYESRIVPIPKVSLGD